MTTATTSPGLADLLDMNPQRAAGLYTLALKLLRDGESPAAAQTLHELALHRPGDVALLPLQASLALAMHRPGEAVRMLGQLLTLNPGGTPAWFNLGQALRLQPEHTGSLQAHANALLVAGAFDGRWWLSRRWSTGSQALS